MTHEFSVEIHEYIKTKIAEAQKGKKQADADGDAESGRFYEGQLHELLNLRDYLTAKVDLKTQKYY
jgi:hypothetical protein